MSIWRATWPKSEKQANFTLFMLGGTGARAVKDGLNTTGFPSGVGGVPAEVIETQAPLLQTHRHLRMDSGGPGKFRGGLGQNTTFAHLGEKEWSVSGMVDRTQFAPHGLQGGQPGTKGAFQLNGKDVPAKTIMWMAADATISMNPPGGGGYGDPFTRDPAQVFDDVVKGYVSLDAARAAYGVVVRFLGNADSLVRLPAHYLLDREATQTLRAAHLQS
jgi:N-methylhydantoinase B